MILNLFRLVVCTFILLQGSLFSDTPTESEASPQIEHILPNKAPPPTDTKTANEAAETVQAESEPLSEGKLDSASRPKVPTYEGAFVKMLIVLLILIFIIFFIIWLIRRLTHHRIRLFNQTRHIKIIERRPLSPKTALYILEIGEKKVLVAESQLEVKALASFEELSTVRSED